MNTRAVFALILLGGCGSEGVRPEDLSPPSAVWNQEADLCGRTLAIDANFDLWEERGCEGSDMKLSKVKKLSEDVAKAIIERFQALLGQEPGTVQFCISRHRFTLTAEAKREWFRCGTGHTTGDLSGLQAPFLDAATAFDGR